MDFSELLDRLKVLPLKENRFSLKNFLEVTFNTGQEPAILEALTAFFGPPFKPAGKVMQDDDSFDFIGKFGGIRLKQTLFFKKEGEITYYAMLWPWSDQTTITLKVEQIKPLF